MSQRVTDRLDPLPGFTTDLDRIVHSVLFLRQARCIATKESNPTRKLGRKIAILLTDIRITRVNEG
jgi:hypothetical protein